jgi:hypothetical protein
MSAEIGSKWPRLARARTIFMAQADAHPGEQPRATLLIFN